VLTAAPLAAAEEAAGAAAAAAAAAGASAAAKGGSAEPQTVQTLQTLVVLGGGGACFGFGALFNPPHATFNWQYPWPREATCAISLLQFFRSAVFSPHTVVFVGFTC
jgi:hypothetical protein